MLFDELAAVLAAAPETASREEYAAAIVEGNCLGKATTATRRLSNQRLGELYEAKGDTAKAIANYEKFIDLWKNAEPALQPKVREVRARLERLRPAR